MNVEEIRIESDDRGFELHVLTTDEGWLYFNIQGVAEQLFDAAVKQIGPWLLEGEAARHSRPSRYEEDPADLPWAERDPEMIREMADNVRKAMKENR